MIQRISALLVVFGEELAQIALRANELADQVRRTAGTALLVVFGEDLAQIELGANDLADQVAG